MLLHSNRIILRPLKATALDLIEQMSQDAETMRFIGGVGFLRAQVEAFIQKQQCYQALNVSKL